MMIPALLVAQDMQVAKADKVARALNLLGASKDLFKLADGNALRKDLPCQKTFLLLHTMGYRRSRPASWQMEFHGNTEKSGRKDRQTLNQIQDVV